MTETAPPTPADLAALTEKHQPRVMHPGFPTRCYGCGALFPCDTAVALRALGAARVKHVLAERHLSMVTFVGHGDDCLFCGFKDRAVKNYEDELAAESAGAAMAPVPARGEE